MPGDAVSSHRAKRGGRALRRLTAEMRSRLDFQRARADRLASARTARHVWWAHADFLTAPARDP